jgi:hypothetical protein
VINEVPNMAVFQQRAQAQGIVAAYNPWTWLNGLADRHGRVFNVKSQLKQVFNEAIDSTEGVMKGLLKDKLNLSMHPAQGHVCYGKVVNLRFGLKATCSRECLLRPEANEEYQELKKMLNVYREEIRRIEATEDLAPRKPEVTSYTVTHSLVQHEPFYNRAEEQDRRAAALRQMVACKSLKTNRQVFRQKNMIEQERVNWSPIRSEKSVPLSPHGIVHRDSESEEKPQTPRTVLRDMLRFSGCENTYQPMSRSAYKVWYQERWAVAFANFRKTAWGRRMLDMTGRCEKTGHLKKDLKREDIEDRWFEMITQTVMETKHVRQQLKDCKTFVKNDEHYLDKGFFKIFVRAETALVKMVEDWRSMIQNNRRYVLLQSLQNVLRDDDTYIVNLKELFTNSQKVTLGLTEKDMICTIARKPKDPANIDLLAVSQYDNLMKELRYMKDAVVTIYEIARHIRVISRAQQHIQGMDLHYRSAVIVIDKMLKDLESQFEHSEAISQYMLLKRVWRSNTFMSKEFLNVQRRHFKKPMLRIQQQLAALQNAQLDMRFIKECDNIEVMPLHEAASAVNDPELNQMLDVLLKLENWKFQHILGTCLSATEQLNMPTYIVTKKH